MDLKYFQNTFNSHQIKMKDEFLDKIYQKFKIFFVSQIEDISTINTTIKKDNIMIIDTMEYNKEEYLIICFEQTIILISKSNISFLENFFTNNINSNFIVISKEIEEIIAQYAQIDKPESKEMIEIYDYIFLYNLLTECLFFFKCF